MSPASFTPACPLPEPPGDTIQLAHGSGGLLTRHLIDTLFRPAFAPAPGATDPTPDFLAHDGATLAIPGHRLAFTTDGYVVRPLFFPGGDIGTLAVNGTVNDLAMCGAEPLYLSVGLIIEEGFPLADLRRVVASMAASATAAGVRLVTGDTKVVERGKGDGLYVTTSGVGRILAPHPVGPAQIRPGDSVLLSGDLARHGIAVMAVREGLGFETTIESDCAPLWQPVRALIDAATPLHCLRDLTRGGLATALIELAEAAGVAIRIDDAAIPLHPPVRGACEILGLDPLYVANEGRFVAIVPPEAQDAALAILRRFDPQAAIIGTVHPAEGTPGASLATLGGSRMLDLPTGDLLPRIC